MRSRYAAFALGLGDYLVRTLAEDHPDRGMGDLARSLSRVRERQRFVGLRIYDAFESEVLFFARVFERGVDRSFGELSSFVRERGEWRYASGAIIPKQRMALACGARLFDRGDFWGAHEAWEAPWRLETDAAMRTFLQGLIQVAASFYKRVVVNDAESAARLLARALEKLDEAPPRYADLDVAAFREALRAHGASPPKLQGCGL